MADVKILTAVLALLLNGNSDISAPDFFTPTAATTWQIQLQGEADLSYDVMVYDLDLFETAQSVIDELHAQDKHVICYFSAGSYEDWREDAGQFATEDLGEALDGWEGENWLDIRSENVREIMLYRLDLAAEKQCDGVDPDNVDGYVNNSGFSLTADDQLEYNQFLAAAAHERGLAIGLKNDVYQVTTLEPYFDFAVNEECFYYNECNRLTPFIDANKPVFSIEYDEKYITSETELQQLCAEASELGFQTLVLPLDLDGSYRYACE